MADARISQLPAATTVESQDIVPFSSISASETRKITANNLALRLTQLGLTVGTNVPSAPYNGQLWVDTTTNPPVLKVYNGASFTVVSFLPGSSVATSPSSTAPSSPVLGQLWLDTSQTPDELKVYDGAAFVRVDPQGITQTAGDGRYLQLDAASGSPTSAVSYLRLTGGTLTGDLTLNGVPSTANMASTKGYVDDEIAAIPAATDLTPAGTIIYTARATAPTGYIKANGAAISRTTFETLFTAIGTIYGAGDGSTTFNVPDLRGEFLRGFDDSRGVDSGRALGTAQSGQNLSHSHVGAITSTGTHPHSYEKTTGGTDHDGHGSGIDLRSGTTTANVSGDGGHGHTVSISADGGTEARPRNIALLACIKT